PWTPSDKVVAAANLHSSRRTSLAFAKCSGCRDTSSRPNGRGPRHRRPALPLARGRGRDRDRSNRHRRMDRSRAPKIAKKRLRQRPWSPLLLSRPGPSVVTHENGAVCISGRLTDWRVSRRRRRSVPRASYTIHSEGSLNGPPLVGHLLGDSSLAHLA